MKNENNKNEVGANENTKKENTNESNLAAVKNDTFKAAATAGKNAARAGSKIGGFVGGFVGGIIKGFLTSLGLIDEEEAEKEQTEEEGWIEKLYKLIESLKSDKKESLKENFNNILNKIEDCAKENPSITEEQFKEYVKNTEIVEELEKLTNQVKNLTEEMEKGKEAKEPEKEKEAKELENEKEERGTKNISAEDLNALDGISRLFEEEGSKIEEVENKNEISSKNATTGKSKELENQEKKGQEKKGQEKKGNEGR